MRTRRKKKKVRNHVAVNAWNKTGAGAHKDRKKESRRNLTKEDLQEIKE